MHIILHPVLSLTDKLQSESVHYSGESSEMAIYYRNSLNDIKITLT